MSDEKKTVSELLLQHAAKQTEHLASIRSMAKFATIVLAIGLAIGILTGLNAAIAASGTDPKDRGAAIGAVLVVGGLIFGLVLILSGGLKPRQRPPTPRDA